MKWSKEQIEKLMTVDKVNILITALEVIAEGNPICGDVAQHALDYFEKKNPHQ